VAPFIIAGSITSRRSLLSWCRKCSQHHTIIMIGPWCYIPCFAKCMLCLQQQLRAYISYFSECIPERRLLHQEHCGDFIRFFANQSELSSYFITCPPVRTRIKILAYCSTCVLKVHLDDPIVRAVVVTPANFSTCLGKASICLKWYGLLSKPELLLSHPDIVIDAILRYILS